MKIKPQIYAQSLIQSVKEDNLKLLAKNFWHILQKNKQYRDLDKILNEVDVVAAENDNKILAKIYSKNGISTTEKETLKNNLEKKFEKQLILKYIINKNITGIIIKIDDKIIDMSLENKINRLKKILND